MATVIWAHQGWLEPPPDAGPPGPAGASKGHGHLRDSSIKLALKVPSAQPKHGGMWLFERGTRLFRPLPCIPEKSGTNQPTPLVIGPGTTTALDDGRSQQRSVAPNQQHPQLPLNTPKRPSNGDHKAVDSCTLGGGVGQASSIVQISDIPKGLHLISSSAHGTKSELFL